MRIDMRIWVLASILILSPALLFSGNLSAKLIIVGPSDQIYTYWGHIGIAIENNDTGKNLFYDFGNFSFYSENFYQDFSKGYMRYLSSVVPTESFITRSMGTNIDLTTYTLNLGDDELKELDEILQWWILPENREYLYDYYINNCSTIIRDILNQITDGQLKAESFPVKDKNFRYYTRTGAHQSLSAEMILHYLIGPFTDKTITGWDSMFLPKAVADFALDFEYTGRDGVRRILAEEETVLRSSTRPSIPEKPRTLWLLLFTVSTLMAITWNIAGNRIIGKIAQSLIVLTVGIPGIILGFFMVITDHAVTYGNINIWPTLPTVLLSLIPIFASRLKHRESIIAWIWTINFIGLLVVIVLKISGIVLQDTGAFLALYCPITLAASYPGLCLKKMITERVGFYKRSSRF